MIQRTATIKILDEINIAIIGLSVKEYEHFYNKFGYYDNGYAFKPQYKLGRWDGKVRLFTKAGKTSIHFIEQILPELKSMGYKIAIKDNRNPITFDLPLITADSYVKYGITLGAHQVEAVNALLDNRGGIAVAATGAGKSYILGALCKELYDNMKLKCLVIVPTTDLVIQTANEIKLFDNDVGMFYGAKKDLHTQHLVSTWQSLQYNPEVMSMFHAIMVDEAHGAKSNVLKTMLMEHGKGAIFIGGVTGTLPKHEADLLQVHYVLGMPVSNVGGRDLIDLGWLAKLRLRAIVLSENFDKEWLAWKTALPEEAKKTTYKKFKRDYFPDYASERAWLKSNKDRNSFLGGFIHDATECGGNSFVLVGGVDFGKRLAKNTPNAIFIDGTDDTKVRKQIYDLFGSNDGIVVIATYRLAAIGLNIKRIFNLFMIDPNKSFIETIQSIGRGLRKADDKTHVNVWDISSDLKYSKRHSTLRKQYYVEQRYPFKEDSFDYNEFYDEKDEKAVDNVTEFVVY